ncbi:MAG: folate-binding protein YgfZ [Alphaproteobacteria bacterium]|nr:folate-binding protein YgfZ [Alphaproteobacteria bacterium]
MSEQRTVFAITGADRIGFLQGLVTNDVSDLGGGLTYAALLSPQGKYLFDFFLFQRGETVFLDVMAAAAQPLVNRLALYKLRADVEIKEANLKVSRGVGEMPAQAMSDPRHPALGWRYYDQQLLDLAPVDWMHIRVENLIPETGIELISGESYILEMGFERLSGVDFRKGCYVGQEVTARMKHKTELKKGLAMVVISGKGTQGAEITDDGKTIGWLHTISGNRAIAYLRFGRATAKMKSGAAVLSVI